LIGEGGVKFQPLASNWRLAGPIRKLVTYLVFLDGYRGKDVEMNPSSGGYIYICLGD
jgi:hypothetical protein